MGNRELLRYFVSVDELLVVTDGVRQMTLCHYPLLSWKRQKRSYMIHGHIHANTQDDFFPLIVARDRMLNAGVDINGFRPVTFEELQENNRSFKEQFLNQQQM
jgi:calcineurin-like phosphoesterase family protein